MSFTQSGLSGRQSSSVSQHSADGVGSMTRQECPLQSRTRHDACQLECTNTGIRLFAHPQLSALLHNLLQIPESLSTSRTSAS